MKRTTDLYDVAVAEVRGQATPDQLATLESDPDAWVEALMSVLDEVDGQLDMRREQYEDDTTWLDPDSSEWAEITNSYKRWRSGVRTFRKHVSVRLNSVERKASVTRVPNRVKSLIVKLHDADEGGQDEEFEALLEALYELVI